MITLSLQRQTWPILLGYRMQHAGGLTSSGNVAKKQGVCTVRGGCRESSAPGCAEAALAAEERAASESCMLRSRPDKLSCSSRPGCPIAALRAQQQDFSSSERPEFQLLFSSHAHSCARKHCCRAGAQRAPRADDVSAAPAAAGMLTCAFACRGGSEGVPPHLASCTAAALRSAASTFSAAASSCCDGRACCGAAAPLPEEQPRMPASACTGQQALGQKRAWAHNLELKL